MHSMRKSLIAASLVGVALVVAPACATKTFVRTEVAPVTEKVGAVDAKVETLIETAKVAAAGSGRANEDLVLDSKGTASVRIGGSSTRGIFMSSGGGTVSIGSEARDPDFALAVHGSSSNVGQRTMKLWNPYDDDNDRILIDFYRKSGPTEVGYISATGTTTTYATGSDRRLKDNVTDSTIGLDTLRRVRAREFNFIADPAHRVPGFIAQELFEVYPHAVSAPTDAGRSWGVDYGKLSPLLVQSVQDLDSLVQNLRTEVDAANRRIGELMDRLRQLEATAALSRAADGAPREVAIGRD